LKSMSFGTDAQRSTSTDAYINGNFTANTLYTTTALGVGSTNLFTGSSTRLSLKVNSTAPQYFFEQSGVLTCPGTLTSTTTANIVNVGNWRLTTDANDTLSVAKKQADSSFKSSLQLPADGSVIVTGNLTILGTQTGGSGGSGGSGSSGSSVVPYYADMYTARLAGVPRWSLFRDGYEATSAKMMILGDAQVGYRSSASGYLSTTGVQLDNPEWTMEGWWYFNTGAGFYLMTLKNATTRVGLEMSGGFRIVGAGALGPWICLLSSLHQRPINGATLP